MFSSGFRTQKLRVNLRLSINRLKLMEKKKTEMALKARKEIADYLQQNKYDRARIRVEHIIREDYLVEAMELLELYCDLLLARFGLIESMKHCDEGLVESVSSIIWAAPRLQSDIAELRVIAEQLVLKYGKEFGLQAKGNTTNTVNEKLIHKLSPDPPPKILVENYLVAIAKNYNVHYEADPSVFLEGGVPEVNGADFIIDNNEYKGGPPSGPGGPGLGFSHFGNNSGGSGGGGMMGGIPSIPSVPQQPGGGSYNQQAPGGPSYNQQAPGGPSFNQQAPGGPSFNQQAPGGGSYPPHDASFNSNQAPPLSQKNAYPPGPGSNSSPYPPNASMNSNAGPPPSYTPSAPAPAGMNSLPDLPPVPSSSLPPPGGQSNQSNGGDDVDFDDLTRRFEQLKKKK